MNIKDLKAYEIIESRSIPDLNSEGYLIKHKKTGAKIILLSNDDENKVFYIGFRTPPSDSTGVPHIMEHSVLCGSEKYPAKDPFVELAKGSLNTFLNAMTYPDKTVYPVASCNDADLANLMDVYLDAVFHPNIYSRPQIFKQEGWHYEIDEPDGDITINGVVYNEMRGVFSSADDMLDREIFDTLFPDTAYAYESGGDPQYIPDLSYEQFLDFHRKYYHPSNSYIYLYGDMDMVERLDYLDREYLSKYDELSIDSALSLQKPFKESVYKEIEYSITNEEPLEDNTYLSYTSVIGDALDKELYLAFQIIEYALLLAPGAILNQTLLDRGIGKDITGSYECGTYQPYFSVVAKNSNMDRLNDFLDTVKEVYGKVASEGFDKKALLAGINFYEFRYREADFGHYPKGLMYGLQALDSWLYDEKQPFMHIAQNDTFDFLRKKIDTDYFENLVKDYLLNNTHSATVVVKPKRGLTAELDKELADKLKAFKSTLSKEEIDELVRDSANLHAYQEEPSTKEELETIPLLTLADMKKEAAPLVNLEKKINETTVLTHDIFTNGIGYLTLCFDFTGLSLDLVPYIGFIKNILGLIDTKNYTYKDLFNEINIETGGITFSSSNYPDLVNKGKFRSMFEVHAKVLYDKLPVAFDMIKEVLFASDFSDKKRLKELLSMLKSRMQASMPSSGHSTAACRAMAYGSKGAYISELINGVDFYRIVDEIESDFANKSDEWIENMQKVMRDIFCIDNLLVDYTAGEDQNEILYGLVNDFTKNLPNKLTPNKPFEVELQVKNEGFKTSSKVQYVAVAGNYRIAGLDYTGALKVLKVIMGYDYLWNNIRVKGGAYGCMSAFTKGGSAYLVSYRDPNLKKTLDVYKNASDYIGNFDADERDMLKYIIGTIADMDEPLTPSAKGSRSLTAFLDNESYEMIQKEREEVLSVNPEIIRGLSKYLRAIIDQNEICVLGGEEKIEDEKDLFKSVVNLF